LIEIKDREDEDRNVDSRVTTKGRAWVQRITLYSCS